MERVGVVIVTYNSGSEIGACLDALTNVVAIDLEIIVVDNASSDVTRVETEKRNVRLIANPTNAGFAAAVNQGVRATKAPLVLSLNPDTCLISGLDAMAACFAEPATGAVGGMLIGDDGKPQTGFMARNLPSPAALIFEVLGINRLWPSNPVNWHYRCLGLNCMEAALVDQPAGAFLMFSRAAWEKVGGLDERFWPIWFEDVDFCARLKSSGFRIYYHPESVAKHSGSHSIGRLVLEKRESYWYGSLLEYAAKHFRSVAFRTTCVAVAVSAVLRAVVGFPRYKFKALEVYGGIAGLALSRAFHGRRASG
jgi:GT2 family glycosyltransferase